MHSFIYLNIYPISVTLGGIQHKHTISQKKKKQTTTTTTILHTERETHTHKKMMTKHTAKISQEGFPYNQPAMSRGTANSSFLSGVMETRLTL